MLISDLISAAAGRSSRAVPLFWWQGWSNRWYVTSVYDLKGFSCAEAGMFVVARKEADGSRTPLVVGAADNISDALFCDLADPLMRALKAGATEVHVHLVNADEDERELAAKDIAEGWSMMKDTSRTYA